MIATPAKVALVLLGLLAVGLALVAYGLGEQRARRVSALEGRAAAMEARVAALESQVIAGQRVMAAGCPALHLPEAAVVRFNFSTR